MSVHFHGPTGPIHTGSGIQINITAPATTEESDGPFANVEINGPATVIDGDGVTIIQEF